ncbi:hypothetical protein QVD99_003308 [Batrachochytrium dendrobatidis]|nr:hypothetical protein QVD99_003308 [Batrachochytrium dendrobatidis]
MKLAVAVLSSILLACSVTIASPIKPSATTSTKSSTLTVLPSSTTSTEASTSPTPNPNGIGISGLYPLPNIIKELLKEYKKTKDSFHEQKSGYHSIRSKYGDQYILLGRSGRKIKVLEYKLRESGGNPEYDGEIRRKRVDLQIQKSKLDDLGRRYDECESRYNHLKIKLQAINEQLVKSVFGRTWNSGSFDQKLVSIGSHPSVMEYLEELCGQGQSSGCDNNFGQNHGDQQQSQDPQPSSSRPSGFGSFGHRVSAFGQRVSAFGQRASSSIQREASRLVHNVGSFFQQPRNDGSPV